MTNNFEDFTFDNTPLDFANIEQEFADFDPEQQAEQPAGEIEPTGYVYADQRDEQEARLNEWEFTSLNLPFVERSFTLFDGEGTDPEYADYGSDLGYFVEKMAPWGKLVLVPVIEVDDGNGNRREVKSALRYIHEATRMPTVFRVTPLFIISTKLDKETAKRECLRILFRDLMRKADASLADPASASGDIMVEIASSLGAWQDPINRDLSATEGERIEKAFAAYVDNHMNDAPDDPNEDEYLVNKAYHVAAFEKFRSGHYASVIERLHNFYVTTTPVRDRSRDPRPPEAPKSKSNWLTGKGPNGKDIAWTAPTLQTEKKNGKAVAV